MHDKDDPPAGSSCTQQGERVYPAHAAGRFPMKHFALLFKTFTKREYAERFLKGHIRAAPLEEYRATEDG